MLNTKELIYTIILVIVVTIFFTFKSKKQKESSWKGELIKKKDIADEDNENHVYRLIFLTDSGKKVKVSVKEDYYNSIKIGDRFEKLKGEYIPRKI